MRSLIAIFIATLSFLQADEMSPTPIYSPEESAEMFEFAEPGYRIELVASEPMVQDPVAIRFDGQGRLWVVEMRGYMRDVDGSDSHKPTGRISVLTDTYGDGLMDESSVFLDGLVLPRAIAILPDGVLVAENKPLWFVQDTDGDLVADEKTLIDENYARDNIEHSANGLYRALDNWFYNAKEGHRYRRVAGEWIREKTERRGQWGICQDNRGRLFYNYNHSQLFTDLVPPNSFSRNPNHVPTTGVNVNVVMSNEVFPIRPNLATNRGYIPGTLDENGSIQQFTSACAPVIYRESLFPEFADNAFVAETAGNLIKRNQLSLTGISATGQPAYPDRDFLASKDERFRPCAIEPGPDGAIYIVDMYRGIVQDAPHMSPYLREISVERKMESPIHFGRIWRIVPEDFRQPEPPDFAALSPPELVALLSHESGWWRDRAQTYLVESNLVEAIPGLIELIDNSDDEWARLHSLWTLEGLLSNLNAINGSGISDSDWLTSTLDDPSPTLRAAALRILPEIGVPHEILAQEIEYRANEDFSPEETLQAILTLGDLDLPSSQKTRLISLLISPIVADPLCRDAALSSLAEQEISFLEQVWDSLPEDKASSPGWEFMLEALAVAGLSRGHPDEVGRLIARLETSEPTWKEAALFASIKALRNDLMAEPIALSKAPSGLNRYPDLAAYFSWPGHTPEPLAISGVEPLDKQERIRFARGRQIYMTSCVACHGSDGGGMKYLAPPLAGSDWVNGSEERLVRILLHGLSGPISVSGKRYEFPEIQAVMPPLAGLDNAEIAAVLTYIRLEWGNTANPISAGDVGQIRIASQGRTIPWTESELQVSQFQAHLPHKKAPDNK